MNPLDWTGPQFLAMYVPLLVVGYVVSWRLGRPPREPEVEPRELGKRLEPFEVALLKGFKTFRDAVVAALVHRQVFHLKGEELYPNEKPPTGMTRLEQSLHRAARGRPLSHSEMELLLEDEAAPLREQLIRKGLLVSTAEAHARRRVPSLVFGAVLALGVVKCIVGLVRERPVGLLFLLLIASGMGWFTLFKMKRGRTPLGDKTLSALASEHEALRTTTSSEGSLPTLSGAEVGLAVALFGTSALAATQMTPLRTYLQQPTTTGADGAEAGWSLNSSGSDTDYGSSDSSSSGDGGGGDSGGSSCGGCGGGGGD